MGVQGLLPFAKAASTQTTASQLARGGVRAAAVDAYCWLHRAAAANPHQPHTHYVRYCMKYIDMLLSHNIKPVLVFDGRHLPAKAATENKRRENRKLAKKRAAELIEIGKISEARSFLRQSVDITHEMALELIKECRSMNVDCIVAPYEADAQLAYLNKINIVQVVITEDSDLLLFGCSKVFFKMDLNGNGVLIERNKLPLIMKCPLERFSFDKFRQMCILSGCDYLSSLPGIGLSKARQFINATRDSDIANALKKMPSFFNKSNMQVSEEYCSNFLKAEATFKHQLVYDPIKRTMIPLTDIEYEGTDMEYCSNAGEFLESNIAFQLAIGNLDPFTLNKMDDWDPDNLSYKPIGRKTSGWNHCKIASHKSIWDKNYAENLKPLPKVDSCNAISIPSTKQLQAKIRSPENTIDNERLTIEHLSSMYCEEPTSKRKKCDHYSESFTYECNEDVNYLESSKDYTNDNSNKQVLEQVSPILKKSNRTYKKIMKNHSRTKLKNMSKFQRTILDENNVIQSKFFESYTPEYSIDITSDADATVNESINSIDIDDNKTSAMENLNEIINENVSVVKNINSNISNLDFLNKVSESSFAEFEIIEKTTSITCLKTEDRKHINPFKKETSIEESDILAPSSSQNIDLKKDDKNGTHENSLFQIKEIAVTKNNNSCRISGLNKRKLHALPSKQQSLLTVFGFQKKTQLKHN